MLPELDFPNVNRGIRRQRSPSPDSSSDDEPAPQRRRLEQATTTGATSTPSQSAAAQREQLDERSLLALKDLVISSHEDKLKKLQEDRDRLAAENARLQAENTQIATLSGVLAKAWQTCAEITRKRKRRLGVLSSPPPESVGWEEAESALTIFESLKDKLAPFFPERLRTRNALDGQFGRLVDDAMGWNDDQDDFNDMQDDAEEDEEEVWGYASDPEDEDMDADDGASGGFPMGLFRDELALAKKGTEKQWAVNDDEDEEAEEMEAE